MSQAGTVSSNTSITPRVLTTFQTDTGISIPQLNTIIILGEDTSNDNYNGIQVQSNPNLGDEIHIVLTNRVKGLATTFGAITQSVMSFTLGSFLRSFRFVVDVIGRNIANSETAGYTIFFTARADGLGNAFIVSQPFVDVDEDPAMVPCDVSVSVTGSSVSVNVTGTTGKTIDWRSLGTYIDV